MLVSDLTTIGNNLYKVRKTKGLTQAEVAELADLSDRTYADIERGSVSMRIDSLLKICAALHITPNEILVTEDEASSFQDLAEVFEGCPASERNTALKLLSVYIDSIK